MNNFIQIKTLPKVPYIDNGDNIADIIIASADIAKITFKENDILCVSSKAVSISEGRIMSLNDVVVSDIANKIHKKIPRKDPRTIQAIIDETGSPDGSRIDLDINYIAGWLPNGLRLTSSGVDKKNSDEVILLPKNPDKSAREIGEKIYSVFGVKVAVIITDSDGRVEKRGATQLAIGLYGIPPIRYAESKDEEGKINKSEETISDMLAASAGLIMGQRGTNKPVVIISGFEFEFDDKSTILESLSRANLV